MTNDLIQAYKNIFKDNKVVLDTYKLSNGYYYLIKNNNKIEKLIVTKGGGDNPELYEYLKIRDFYSVYLNSNKSIDTTLKQKIDNKEYNMLKKIASNNMYTVFFKNRFVENFCSENEGGNKDSVPVSFFKEGISKYYDSLYNLEKGETNKTDNKLSNKKKTEGYTKEEIQENLQKMQNAFDKVLEDFQNEDKPKDVWIKIFLDNTEEEYERVSDIYVNLKIFNKDTNKVLEQNEIYGINNYNFNANSKKPYLELKTTTYKIASLIGTEDINVLRRIYIWLYNNGMMVDGKPITSLKLPKTFDFHGGENDEQNIENENIYEMKITNDNGTAAVDSFEFIPNFTTKIVEFKFRNILNDKEEIIQKTSNIYGLEWLINNVWITHNMKSETNYIRNSYFDYEDRIAKSKALQNWKKVYLRTYANCFKELFQKESTKVFIQNLNKMAVELIENTIVEDYKNNKYYKENSLQTMNLWLCLDEYFNKKETKIMKIKDVQKRCKSIVLENEKLENDDEYYFLVGQVAYFLLSKSKASKLTQDVTEPFIKANNIKVLRNELKSLYEKYNYDINLRDKKFNNIYSQILLAEPETSVKENKDSILAGILSDNLFYTKKLENNGGNENEEK